MYIVFLVKFCHVFLVGFHEAVYTFPLLLHIIFLHLRVISGCYNIKTGPGCSIELMKFDMGGSSAVLGVTKALGQIKPLGVEVSNLCYCSYLPFFLYLPCLIPLCNLSSDIQKF